MGFEFVMLQLVLAGMVSTIVLSSTMLSFYLTSNRNKD